MGDTLRWLGTHLGATSRAYLGASALFYDGKITTINQNKGAFRFDGEKWESDTDFPYISYRCFFIDSRGIIYVGGERDDSEESFIYESTNGLNFTQEQALTITADAHAFIWDFTEDKHRNVWAGEYSTGSQLADAHLWRRKPDGSWTKVMTWDGTGGTIDQRHIHWVYYCPYRDALYIAIGDTEIGILKLDGSKLNQDTYVAGDFEYILPVDEYGFAVCVTAMTSDEKYLYVGMDMHVEHEDVSRAIARITDDGETQTMEYVYPLTKGTLWTWAHIHDGVIVFNGHGSTTDFGGGYPFVNIIVASDDHGDTWTVVKDWGTGQVKGLGYTGLPSHYYNNWDGIHAGGNGWGGKYGVLSMGRVVPVNTTFYVDKTNGKDWTNFGISEDKPIKSLEWLSALDIDAGDTVQFIGNNTYGNPLIADWSGEEGKKISIKGNPSSVLSGGSMATVPLFSEDFEGAKEEWGFALGEAGGSISVETTIVKEGSQSAKIVRDGVGVVSLSKSLAEYNIHEGDTFYVRFYIYYPDDVPDVEHPVMLRIIGDSNFEQRLDRYGSTSFALTNEIVLRPDVFGVSYRLNTQKALTSGEWHKIEIEMLCHPTVGKIQLRVDDELQAMINGIKTQTSGGKINSIYFYLYQYLATFYIDDFKAGIAPFDDRGALNTNDHDYLDVSIEKYQGAVGAILSSGSKKIRLYYSIFDGLIDDAVRVKGGDNIELYNLSIYNSGGHGLNIDNNCTIKNIIVFKSAGNDIHIASGKTVIGGNNCFEDAAKGGDGAYTDIGSTTLWNKNPLMIDPGNGDFRLQPGSPCINVGIDVGLIEDYIGNPVGTFPDIGAFERLQLLYKERLLDAYLEGKLNIKAILKKILKEV